MTGADGRRISNALNEKLLALQELYGGFEEGV